MPKAEMIKQKMENHRCYWAEPGGGARASDEHYLWVRACESWSDASHCCAAQIAAMRSHRARPIPCGSTPAELTAMTRRSSGW